MYVCDLTYTCMHGYACTVLNTCIRNTHMHMYMHAYTVHIKIMHILGPKQTGLNSNIYSNERTNERL